jgi:tetratricopeptide (TPR) repeat protein
LTSNGVGQERFSHRFVSAATIVAIRLNPKYAEAYCSRGCAYGKKGEHDREFADYSEAIRLNPKYSEAYYNRGLVYEHKGDHDKAIGDLDAAVKLSPKRACYREERGAIRKHTLEFDFKYDGLGPATLAFNSISGIGRGGTGVLKVDGKEVANQKMERTLPLILQWDETFDIGSDTGTSVCDQDYQVPFKFTGKLIKLTLNLDRPQLSPADIRLLEQEGQRNNKASE